MGRVQHDCLIKCFPIVSSNSRIVSNNGSFNDDLH